MRRLLRRHCSRRAPRAAFGVYSDGHCSSPVWHLYRARWATRTAHATRIIALMALLGGCTTYGGPPSFEPAPRLESPTCSLAIAVLPPTPAHERDAILRTGDQLVETLESTGWFAIVGYLPDLSNAPDFIVTLDATPPILNEPYLAVLSLGVIPNPVAARHGFRFGITSADGKVDRKVDTWYLTTGWFGWLASAIAILPGQHLSPQTQQDHEYIASLLAAQLPELLLPCG